METKLILDFLADLSNNNNRDWFEANKPRFVEAKTAFEEIVQGFIDGIAGFDPGLAGLQAKKCVFRIYRDVRFSKDKSPYKLNFGANMTEGGRKSPNPGYYIHLKPGDCFFGGGLYHPEAENLKKVRQEIDYNFESFLKIAEDKKFKSAFGDIWGEKLKRAPKDYTEDHPLIDYLKLKDFVVLNKIGDKEVVGKNYFNKGIEAYKMIKPFNDFFKAAIS